MRIFAFIVSFLFFSLSYGAQEMLIDKIVKKMNSSGEQYAEFSKDESVVCVKVKPKDYTHFRQTISYKAIQKHIGGEVVTMVNETKVDIYVEIKKRGAIKIIQANINKENGEYEILIKKDKDYNADKLSKDIEKVFKKDAK